MKHLKHRALSSHWKISSVRCRSFKSFGAEWTEISLDCPHFVGITGPNGSGKSSLLEAVQFACGAPAPDLRARTLKALCNTDTPGRLCEVEVQFSEYSPVGRSGAKPCWIRAALTPEGGRSFQIDGRNKTLQQVKDFLCGLSVQLGNANAVIRQAAVTSLADRNTPQVVAAVVAAASGLARWNEETAMAYSELGAARKALQDILANVANLDGLMQQDNKRLEQVAASRQITQDITATVQKLAAAYAAQRVAAAGAMSKTQARIAELQMEESQLSEQLQGLRTTKKEQEAIMSPVGTNQSEILQHVSKIADLEQQVQAAEQQLAAATAGQQEHNKLTAQLHGLMLEEAAVNEALSTAERRLQALHDTVQQAKDEEQSDVGNHIDSLEGLLSGCTSTISQLKASMEGHQAEVSMLQQQLKEATTRESWLRGQKDGAAAAAAKAAHALPGLVSEKQSLEQQVKQAKDDLMLASVRSKVLQAQLGLKASGLHPFTMQTGPAVARQQGTAIKPTLRTDTVILPARLHTLFKFKDAMTVENVCGDTASMQQNRNNHCVGKQHRAPSTMQATGRMKDGETLTLPASAWTRALSVVAGNNLDVIVVSTLADATAALRDPNSIEQSCGPLACNPFSNRPSKLRLWPLDQISFSDRTAAQRAAQTALGPDRVMLPLDLIEYSDALHPAMVRAFGNYVLAKDSDAAAVLINRFGLPSVTPDGTISKKGTLSGGFMGNTGRGQATGVEAVLQNKMELQSLEAQQAQLSKTIDTLQSRIAAVQQQVHVSQQSKAAAGNAAREHADATTLLARLQAEHSASTSRLANTAQELQQVQEDAAKYNALYEAHKSASSSKRHGAFATSDVTNLRQLQQQQLESATAKVKQLEAQAAELEQKHSSVEKRLRQLELQRVGMIENLGATADEDSRVQRDSATGLGSDKDSMSRSTDWGVEKLTKALGDLTAQLEVAKRDLGDARAAACEQERSHKQRKQQAAELQQEVHKLQQQLSRIQQALAKEHEQLDGQQKGVQQVVGALRQLTSTYGMNIPTREVTDDMAQQVDDLQHQLSKLKVKLKSLGPEQELSSAEEMAVAARRQDVSLFRERAAALAAGVEALDAGMTASHQQVMAAHNAVFAAIRSRFTQLCASLLPSLRFTLGQPTNNQGGCINDQLTSEGCVILFHRLATEEKQSSRSDNSSNKWSSSLEQLSGGQRTLVSLALLLAAAFEGSHSSIVLLDEVDAALDEGNQRALAELLTGLSHGSWQTESSQTNAGSNACGRTVIRSGAQILCVSHNAAFQQCCDSLVQVSKVSAAGQANATSLTAVGGAAGNKEGKRSLFPDTKNRKRKGANP